MKTRIISALVGAVLLLGILFCPYLHAFLLACGLLSAMAVWELLHNTGIVKENLFSAIAVGVSFATVLIAGCVADSLLPFLKGFGILALLWLLFGVFAVLLFLKKHETLSVSDGGSGIFLALYATVGFTSLGLLRFTEQGLLAIFLCFIIPWMSDTGAYFVGSACGKHKMTPVISPKKSWEGFFGGWAFSIICTVLTGVIFNAVAHTDASLWRLAVMGFVLAPLSVCGDLFASVVKRQHGIKDYGKIMPGHGGVMDRFDSVLIIAPLLLVLLLTLGV